jgi:N-acetylmuramoyl-L-alanine amidase
MASSSGRLEADSNNEGRKRPEASHEHLHRDGYTAKSPEHKAGADKNVHNMSIVDKHGHPVERVHHVKKGETLSSIARHELTNHKNHPSQKDVGRFAHRIAHANDIKSPYHIHAGQELLIPKHGHHAKPGTQPHKQTGEPLSQHQKPGEPHHQGQQALDAKAQGQQPGEHHARRQHAGTPDAKAPGASDKANHHRPQHTGDRAPDTAPTRRPAPHREAPAAHRVAQEAPEVAPPAPAPQAQPQEQPVVQRHDAAPQIQQRPDFVPASGPVPDVAPPQEVPAAGDRTGILAGKVIVIDPGHGGQDSGAVGGGVAEKSITPV